MRYFDYTKLLLALILFAGNVRAEHFGVNNIRYNTLSGSEVEVLGYVGNTQTLVLPSTVQADSITYKVVRIAQNAFKGSIMLETVQLPDSVREIGAAAFAECTALDNISFPATLELIDSAAFRGCSSFDAMEFKGGNTFIGKGAFDGTAWPTR